MKKKEEVRSFKDNLKSLLLRHSFRPALQMEIICILLVVVIGGWWGIASNREANSHVCEALEQTITVYGELLDQLSAEDHIINPETSLTRRTLILKSLYTASARAGYEANMYILDPEGNILVSSRETVSDEEKVLVRNWNILEQLKESPEQIQMDVSRGSNRTLLLAKAVVADGRIQGSIVMQVGGSVYDKLLAANAGKTVIAQKDYWVLDTNGYQFVDPIGRLVNSMRESQGLKIFEKGIYYVRHQEVGGGNLEVYTFFDYTDTVRVLAMVLLTGIVVLAFLFFAGLSNTEKMAVKATEGYIDAERSISGGNGRRPQSASGDPQQHRVQKYRQRIQPDDPQPEPADGREQGTGGDRGGRTGETSCQPVQFAFPLQYPG